MPRKKGTPNKITQDVKQRIQLAVEDNFYEFLRELATLSGKAYTDTFLKMLEFIMPKAKETADSNSVNLEGFTVQLIENGKTNISD